MIKKIYYKYIPVETQQKINRLFLEKVMLMLRTFKVYVKSKFIYIFQIFITKTDQNICYMHMGKYGLTHYPGEYELSYKKVDVDVYFDEKSGYPYVIHNQKHLYFIPETKKECIKYYKSLVIEQDKKSPHSYVNNYNLLTGKILLDVGSAEGIFALDVIEYVEHAYLFECEDVWIEALKQTFAPWKDKVTIIKKYVGIVTDDNNITIDSFLKENPMKSVFIKMDIEGAEQIALQGAAKTLKTQEKLDLAICTYHRKNDEKEILNILCNAGLKCEQTKGFLFMDFDMRRGVVRASRI